MAAVLGLLITGLTFFVSPIASWDYPLIKYTVTNPGIHVMPVTRAGFPLSYYTNVGAGYTIFFLGFIIDFSIYFVICFAIIFVINKEREKNAKGTKDEIPR